MSRALDGLVVLDLTRQFCSSLSSAFLGDFGAWVIRLSSCRRWQVILPVAGITRPT